MRYQTMPPFFPTLLLPMLPRNGCTWAFFCYILGMTVVGAAQSNDTVALRMVSKIKVSAKMAALDNLGNIYIVTSDNMLEKYAFDGRKLAHYSQNRLGKVSFIDVSSPMKIMVFYPDFRKAVLLDRNLTFLGELDFDKSNLPFVTTMATARDGNFWVYDESQFQLKKINAAGESMYESQPLNRNQPAPPHPVGIIESDNLVFLGDSTQGFFVFDPYAQYTKMLSAKGVQTFSATGKMLHWLQNGQLWSLDTSLPFALPKGRPINLPPTGLSRIFKNFILCTTAETVQVFAILD